MEDEYLDQLSEDVQALVAEIEQKAELEIEIEVDPSRAKGLPDQPDPLACVIDEFGVRILLPKADQFPEGAVLHELLHARRFLVEGIPQIAVCDDHWNDKLEQSYTALDNSLEHMIVVAEELARRPDRRSRWVSTVERALTRVEAGKLPEIDRDITALLVFALSKHVLGNGALLGRAEALLDRLGLRLRAAKYFADLVPSLASKEKMTAVSFSHFGLSKETACFHYIDAREHEVREVSLSKV